jgi:hypothetical protein
MAWFKTGTISVTNGSPTVTGSGTTWIANAQVGEALYAPDGRLYEITNIASDTSMTITPAYLGTGQSGQAYTIVPSQSYIRDLAAQAADLVNNYSTIANTIGQGKFPDGTLAAPSFRFSDDLDTGFYRSGTNEVTFVAGGVAQFKYNTSGLQFTGNLASPTVTGDLSIADKIVHTGDTNTAIRFPANDTVTVETNGSERVRVDSSGNVGIGTASPGLKLDTGGVTATGLGGLSNMSLYAGFGNSGTFGGVAMGAGINGNLPTIAAVRRGSDGAGLPLSFYTDGTERMRILANGNIAIGTTGATDKFTVAGAASITELAISKIFPGNFWGSGTNSSIQMPYGYLGSNGGFNFSLYANGYRNTSGTWTSLETNGSTSACGIDLATGNGAIIFRSDGTKASGTGTDITERMRIDSSGNVLVGTTSTSPANSNVLGTCINPVVTEISRSGGISLYLNRDASNGNIAAFNRSGTTVGTISVDASSTSYNTSSDYRLKENIVDAPSASDSIDGIKVRSFDWKADGSHQKFGMVAQELETVAPEAVSKGETEDDMWSVDYSKLVPMLIKEVQSLRARVAQLEGN